MNSAQMGVLLRHIRTLAGDGNANAPLDGELLERFSASRDEEAFADLVQRHGPMVWSVCRHVLHNWHDTEDVFQATFLVLARKAASIYRPESLASWLYGVAYHLAVKAQARSARQQPGFLEKPGFSLRRQDMASADPLLDMTWRELRTTLYEELSRLPEKNRTPLVLCYLQGKTQGEAARLLGWTKETVRGRLDRGREQLRKRLTRRGLALTSALFSTLLAHDQALAVPASLLKATVKSAALMAAGKVAAAAISSKVTALASSGLKDLFVSKVKITGAILLAVCTAGTGAGILGIQALADGGSKGKPATGSALVSQENGQSRSGKTPGQPAATQGKTKVAQDEMLTITGRVVDANDKPLVDVPVVILGIPKSREDKSHFLEQKNLGQTKTGPDGRFRLAISQTSLSNYQKIYGLAGQAKHGLVWEEILLGRQGGETIVRLPEEKIIRGRLVDLQGRPAVGVQIKLADGEQAGAWLGGVPKEVSWLWPEPMTTGMDGKFIIRGLSPRLHGYLKIESDQFAPLNVEVKSDKDERIQEVNLSLAPAQIVEGAVTAADTGKPLAHARLVLNAGDNPDASPAMGPGVVGETDEQGHFRLNPYPGKMFTLRAEGPAGQAYLKVEESFKWPKGAVKHKIDLSVPRGVLVRGQVTEAASGKPVAGAIVRDTVGLFLNPTATTDPDGKFQLAVAPDRRHLLIKGPDNNFIPVENADELQGRKPSGGRLYPDAVVPLDLKPDMESYQVAAQLRRGVTIRGSLLKPDGKSPAHASLLCWNQVPQHAPMWFFGAGVSVFKGQFELRGCDPDKTYTVYFLDAKDELGATVKLSAKETRDKPVTVRLSPCGAAEARFVDKDGNPLPRFQPLFYIVARPGPRGSDKELSADNDFVANVDRLHYPNGSTTLDKEGRGKYPCLIPGATYRILDYDLNSVKDFSVESGQTLKLGDIVINRPQ